MNAVGPYRLAEFDEAPADVRYAYSESLRDECGFYPEQIDPKHWEAYAADLLDLGDERLAIVEVPA